MSQPVEHFDYLFRVIIIGDSGVGKSNLLLRYIKNEFDPSSHSTIGVDFSTKTIKIDSKVIKAQIWDTAGQDRFKSISTAFYRGSAAAIIVFDLTSYNSFVNVSKWLEEIKRYADTHAVLMLVGNKSDLKSSRVVNIIDAKAFAERNNMSYIETSALDSTNVETAFVNVLNDVYNVYSQFKRESILQNDLDNDSNGKSKEKLNSISLEKSQDGKGMRCCY